MRFADCLLACLFLMTPFLVCAKHGPPRTIESIIHNQVQYVVPNDKGLRAYVEARDVQSGRKLWTKTILRHWYIPIPPFGTECMRYEYLTSMILGTNQLVLTSERGRVYALDLRTRAVRRLKRKPLTNINKASRAADYKSATQPIANLRY